MQYKILPFLITDTENMSVIQNARNTVIIKDETTRKFFRQMDESLMLSVSNEDIQKVYGEQFEVALDFMLKNQLIKKINEKIVDYDDVVFVSNDSLFLESIEFNSKGLEKTITCEILPNDYDVTFSTSKKFYILFLNPFNFNYFTNLIKNIQRNNILVKIAFYYNHRIYVSNYYKPEWFNPCPLCLFSNIESTLMGKSKAKRTISFQTLVNLIYSKVPNFEIKNKFTHFNFLLLAETLLNGIVINKNRQINVINIIDFNNNIISSDEAIYWEVCDCYE